MHNIIISPQTIDRLIEFAIKVSSYHIARVRESNQQNGKYCRCSSQRHTIVELFAGDGRKSWNDLELEKQISCVNNSSYQIARNVKQKTNRGDGNRSSGSTKCSFTRWEKAVQSTQAERITRWLWTKRNFFHHPLSITCSSSSAVKTQKPILHSANAIQIMFIFWARWAKSFWESSKHVIWLSFYSRAGGLYHWW